MRFENLLTIPKAAELYGVSRQRMHQLLRTYGVETIVINPRMRMVSKRELKKIPVDRPPGPIEYREK